MAAWMLSPQEALSAMTELFAGGDKLLAGVGKERWRCRGSCWRYLPPRRRRGRCLPGCVSWVGQSSSGGSRCSAAPGVAGARAVWRCDGRQDLRAVHDSEGPCSEKGPFMARSSHGVSPNGCLQGFSDAWRAYPAKASSFWMHGARILPRTGDFPVRGTFWDA